MSFNPSFGILPIQTRNSGKYELSSLRFQSLVRDSAHSDLVPGHEGRRYLVFQSLVRDSAHSDGVVKQACRSHYKVSIPRSGFCPFRPSALRFQHLAIYRFNPSFGILPIQTWDENYLYVCVAAVSIPRSGFCPFRLLDFFTCWRVCPGFNPSFGILPIQTTKD